MLRKFFALFILSLLLYIPLSATAQDDTESYEFETGTQLVFPAESSLVEGRDFVIIALEGATLTAVDYPLLRVLAPEAETPVEFIEAYLTEISVADVEFDADAVEELEIEGREAARLTITQEELTVDIVAIRFTGEQTGLLNIISEPDSLPDLLQLAAEFNNERELLPCTVQTAGEAPVQVRLGPGENRAVLRFLPSGQSFPVIDATTDRDGAQWWQIERDAVARGYMVSEAWVSAESVETAGECDLLLVTAPVEIPEATPPPTTAPDAPRPVIESDENATWTATFGMLVASCEDDTESTNYPYETPEPQQVSVQFLNEGVTLLVGTSQLARLTDTTYEGWQNFEFDGEVMPARFFLRIDSDTQMSGELSINFNNATCSATIPVTLTRNP